MMIITMPMMLRAIVAGRLPTGRKSSIRPLRIEDDPYPFGWRHKGHFINHNNYHVARILKFGWPHRSAAQRLEAANAVHSMLDWILKESFKQNGSFEVDPTFLSSLAAQYHFGVSFLD